RCNRYSIFQDHGRRARARRSYRRSSCAREAGAEGTTVQKTPARPKHRLGRDLIRDTEPGSDGIRVVFREIAITVAWPAALEHPAAWQVAGIRVQCGGRENSG